jgi:ribosome maturation factor RimP
MSANLNTTVSQTVTGLGYVLVEIERSAGGLLRITIDHPWSPDVNGGQEEALITVEDCERVTRQLQYVLEVEAVDYKRLEVASPGIDRPLLGESDFERFTGEMVDLTLKVAIGSEVAAQSVGAVNANRKKFRGKLGKSEAGGWQIELENEAAKPLKPGAKVSKKKLEAPATVMGFTLDELKEARLAPIVDFKGRKPKTL